MSDGTWLPTAGLVLVAASVVLAVVERMRKGSFSRAPKLDSDPAPLRAAAALAYDYAKRQRLPIAAAAERKSASDDAVSWFENSLLRTVPVSARSAKTGEVKVLGSHARSRLCAVPGGIAERADGEAVFVDPTVSARNFKAYLHWARSLW